METKTIPRIKVTPKTKRLFRGVEREIENPAVGSIISVMDNGYGNGVNHSIVVTSIKAKKDGIVTLATCKGIISITEDSVTYDEAVESYSYTIKPYHGGGWSRWNTYHGKSVGESLLHFLTFDRYTETTEGYLGGK